MNGCERFGEEIGAYLDGELAERDRLALEAHLPDCAACEGALAGHRELFAALAGLPQLEPGPQFEARFWARLARQAQDSAASPWRIGRRWLEGALAAAVLAGLVFVFSNGSSPLPEEDWQIVSQDERFDLLASDDLEVLSELEVLETWDGSEQI